MKFDITREPSTRLALIFTSLLAASLLFFLYLVQWFSAWSSSHSHGSHEDVSQYSYPENYKGPVSDYYAYYAVPRGGISIGEAIKTRESGSFERWPDQHIPFNLGLKNKEIWFYVPVQNHSSRDICLVWHLRNTLDTAQLYSKSGNTIIAHQPFSFSTPLHQRSIPLRAMFDSVWLHPGEQRELYLKLWKNRYNTYAPMSLLPLPELLQEENFLSNVYCVYIGVFLFIIFFNMFLYYTLRDKIHLVYSFFIICVCMILVIDAYFDLFIFPDRLFRIFTITETIPFADWAVAGTGGVMQILLQQDRKNSRFYIPLLVLFGLDLFWGLVQLAAAIGSMMFGIIYHYHFFHVTSDLLIFCSVFLILAGIFEKIIQRHPIAILYFLTSLLPILGLINFYLNDFGLIGFPYIYPNSIAGGIMLEVIVLTVLLVQRYNQLQKEKNQLLVRQLDLQKEITETVSYIQRSISSDLHDGVGSLLAGLRLIVNRGISHFGNKGQEESANMLRAIEQQLDRATEDIRSISQNLVPKNFEQHEFTEILKDHLASVITTTRIDIEYHLDPQINGLSRNLQLALYRIFAEQLSNTCKYSMCRHVTLQMMIDDNYVRLMTEDDGKKFSEGDALFAARLKNIQLQVQHLRGKATADSGVGGTTLIIDIPLK